MQDYLEKALLSFRTCFSRKAAFSWFVTIVIAFMLREDHLGVTSTIRALLLDHGCYHALLNFFRSEAYTLQSVRTRWYRVVRDSGLIYVVESRVVLAGDGVKQSKEGYRMPGVKKLHQESEDSSKGEYIFGHLFGAVGVVITNARQFLCLPLHMSIQDGLKAAAGWEGSEISGESHVVQMIKNGFEAAGALGRAVLLLDRYFLTIPAIRKLDELNRSAGQQLMEIVTKAKRNCVAYELPPEREPGKRGRPPKKGKLVILSSLFEKSEEFTNATADMYGKKTDVRYLCRDLLWGKGLYAHLRFVLVIYDGAKSILVSTDRSLSPVSIIELYARRFRIENLFREFKQQIGGFCYHFWTRKLSKLNHFKTKDAPDNLDLVKEAHDRKKVLQTIGATERFVQIACIAMGLIQMMILKEPNTQEIQKVRYLRTKTEGRISEATMICYLRKVLLFGFAQRPDSVIKQIISAHQVKLERTKEAS